MNATGFLTVSHLAKQVPYISPHSPGWLTSLQTRHPSCCWPGEKNLGITWEQPSVCHNSPIQDCYNPCFRAHCWWCWCCCCWGRKRNTQQHPHLHCRLREDPGTPHLKPWRSEETRGGGFSEQTRGGIYLYSSHLKTMAFASFSVGGVCMHS